MPFVAGQKVTAAQLNAVTWTATQSNKTTNQALTTSYVDLAGCSVTITSFVASAVIKITASLDLEATGAGDIGIISCQVGASTLTGDLNFNGTGRHGEERTWVHTLGAAGSYTVKLKGMKIGTANTLQCLATHSRLIIEGAGFTF